MKITITNRKLHRWAAIAIALPLIIIIASGIILQLKKEFDWVQPPTMKGGSTDLKIGFDRILDVARAVPEAGIETWKDIERLDVRPNKGIAKVRCVNHWEVQIDTRTGDILQVALRRSDVVEDIHDGSFFHKRFKLFVFLPTALILIGLWGTGIYLFVRPYLAKRKHS